MISHISACMKPSAALECCVRAPLFLFSVLLCFLIHPKQNNFTWHAQHTLALLWTHPSHMVGILGCSETLGKNPQSPMLCFLLEVISYTWFFSVYQGKQRLCSCNAPKSASFLWHSLATQLLFLLCQSSNLITHAKIQPACPIKEQKQFNVIHGQD